VRAVVKAVSVCCLFFVFCFAMKVFLGTVLPLGTVGILVHSM
jgi:hypothetical protein